MCKIIEPSLLAFYKNSDLESELRELKKIGIKRIHYDVMDGIYVPNCTFSTQYIEILKKYNFEIEIHLMVQNPIYFYKLFEPYYPNAIIFHPSILTHEEIIKIMKLAKNNFISVGLAINLDENFQDYTDIFPLTNINLIMGVQAGKGGQEIQEKGIQHLNEFKSYLEMNNLNIPIVFDGGVNDKTIHLIYNNSDFIVSGSYLMKSENKKVAYEKLLNNN